MVQSIAPWEKQGPYQTTNLRDHERMTDCANTEEESEIRLEAAVVHRDRK